MRLSSFQIIVIASLTVFLGLSAEVKGASGNDNSRKKAGISDLRLKVGESFLQARSRIVGHGWKPIRMHFNDNYEYDGAEKRLAEHRFLEVDSCSIDAGANCILYYSKAGRCLRLDTVGEQVVDMKVARWTNECPPGKS